VPKKEVVYVMYTSWAGGTKYVNSAWRALLPWSYDQRDWLEVAGGETRAECEQNARSHGYAVGKISTLNDMQEDFRAL
jgi:hypothetical protein